VDLEFRQLQVFCEVVRLKSFSRASRNVRLSQASVSERIAALEEEVGARLLDRSRRRGVRPTPVGQALFDRAIRLLDDRERVVQEVSDLLGLRQGRLVLGASSVPASYHLPDVMRAFAAEVPRARFSLSIAGSEQVAAWVAAGSHEIGVAGDPGGRSLGTLAKTRLWQDPLVLAVPPGHPFQRRRRVSIAELTTVPFVVREPGSGTRRWLETYLEDKLPGGAGDLSVLAEMGSLSAVKQAVILGLGVSVLSARSVEAEVNAGLLATAELVGPPLRRWFYLIRDPRRTLSPLCRRFSEFLLRRA
jgi:DNA-binding transcriptional LysR family regulator